MRTMAGAAAEDEPVLQAVAKAKEMGLCNAVLVGEKVKIESLLKELHINDEFRIIDEKSPAQAAKIAANLVREGECDILMKGLVDTKSLLRAVLDKEKGLATGNLISHVAAFEVEGYDRMLFVTDAAMNTYPGLKEKVGILNNAVHFVTSLGVEKPKVAVVCAVEVVNEAMQATIYAAMLSKMNDRG